MLSPDALHPARWILDKILLPLQEALQRTGRWLTLSEAIRQSGRSERYFRAPLDHFGGLSRLERWKEQGLATQEGKRWMIAPAVVPEPRGAASPSDFAPMSAEEILRAINTT